MTDFNWSLPMFDDDGCDPGSAQRPASISYLTSIAHAAEAGGFRALLLGAGYSQRVEAFTTAAAVLQHCHRIHALIAVRPGFYHPAIAAKLAATVDQHSDGRVLLNVVTGGVPSDLARYGDTLDHDERYSRTAEFLDILRRLFREPDPIDHSGRYFECSQTRLDYGLCGSPEGRIYFGGFSEPARDLAARMADVYLLWGLPVSEIAESVADLRQRADAHGRTLRFGLRINIVARPTTAEAWEHVRRIESMAADSTVASIRSVRAETDSVGQRRMFQLSETNPTRQGTYWTGLGHLRVGSGTALVGSYRDVADALLHYQNVGIDAFILAASPHLEECLRVGEQVLPLCRD